MTDPIPFKPVDGGERKALADEAKGLLANKAFSAAILGLRKEWFAELMMAHDDGAAINLTMKLQALEAIPQRLQILINDQAMAEARKK